MSGLADTKSFVDSSILPVSVLHRLSAHVEEEVTKWREFTLNHSGAVWVIRKKTWNKAFPSLLR